MSKTETAKHDLLSKAFDPDRLAKIPDIYYAWADKHRVLDGEGILDFFANDVSKQLYELCYTPALQPLSTLPLDEIPPMIPYLSPPDSPDFPRQALGLHLQFDQATRQLLHGEHKRWLFGFFGELAIKFHRELAELPLELQPHRISVWLSQGYSFEHAWLRTFTYFTASIHSEVLGEQLHGQDMVEDRCRKSAEQHYGTTDPYRKQEVTDSANVALFAKMFPTMLKEAKGASEVEAIWRFCRISRAHEPIVRKFGRYPYRNWALGREDTEEEREYLASIDFFLVGSEEQARTVRGDVEVSWMRPLPEKLPDF